MDLLPYTAPPLHSGERWDSFYTLTHCWGAVGCASPSIHRLTTGERWVVDLLRYTTSLLGSSRQWMVALKRSEIMGGGDAVSRHAVGSSF